MKPILLAAISVGVSLVSACADDGGHGDEPVNCELETRDDNFVVGFSKAGTEGTLEFQIMSTTPAPAAAGDNIWVVQINQLAGAVVGSPVTGAELFVTPFMPDHGHVSPIDVQITTMPTAGQYQLSPVNLWMPGLWETTIEATSASGTDEVVFKVCVPS